MEKNNYKWLVLEGAEQGLPPDHFSFDGRGFSIYTARQPRSSWVEHSHDWIQLRVGLEPAHMFAEWRTGEKSQRRKEFVGNSVSVSPDGESHRLLWRREATIVVVYLRPRLLRETARRMFHESFELRSSQLVRDPFIEELARVLHIEAKGGNLTGAVANAAVTLLCPHLLRSYSSRSEQVAYPKGVLGPARERRIRNHIENALDQDLSISALARIVRLVPEHFAVLFRNSTGFTPHQYVNHRRVAEAQRLLADEDLTLAEISHRCGFSGQSQFTTTFRRYAGVTPGKFRHSLVVPTKT